jgi:hypothetical protein
MFRPLILVQEGDIMVLRPLMQVASSIPEPEGNANIELSHDYWSPVGPDQASESDDNSEPGGSGRIIDVFDVRASAF